MVTNRKKIGVVILNYNSCEDTINCCNSLKEQECVNLQIIVVDNNSKQKDKERLRRFCNNDIVLLENRENLGFAKGNNVGIVFARNELNCDYIFVINSDTLMLDNNVINRLISNDSEGVGLISPECYGFDKKTFQLPYCLSNGNTIKEIFKLFSLVAWHTFKSCLGVTWSIHKMTNMKFDHLDYKYIIQGNAYMLTPLFFENYNMLFPNTFLYLEETVLLWYLKKAGMTTRYVPEAVVLHKEAGSNRMPSKEKELYKAKEMRKSFCKIFPILFMSKRKIVETYNQ